MQFATMEGFKTMEMGINLMPKKVKPDYRLVGFCLDGGGGHIGALNATLSAEASYLVHFIGFHWSFIWFFI